LHNLADIYIYGDKWKSMYELMVDVDCGITLILLREKTKIGLSQFVF
jgi:hypothetical protein